MKCDNCGLAEAEVEFEVKTKDGATVKGSHNLCWACLDQRMGSIMEEKEGMKCTNCGHTIRPKSAYAMKDKDGRVFCDVNCACDFYIDTMRLACIKLDKDDDKDENKEKTHDTITRI